MAGRTWSCLLDEELRKGTESNKGFLLSALRTSLFPFLLQTIPYQPYHSLAAQPLATSRELENTG